MSLKYPFFDLCPFKRSTNNDLNQNSTVLSGRQCVGVSENVRCVEVLLCFNTKNPFSNVSTQPQTRSTARLAPAELLEFGKTIAPYTEWLWKMIDRAPEYKVLLFVHNLFN